jgi:hypothetical protein
MTTSFASAAGEAASSTAAASSAAAAPRAMVSASLRTRRRAGKQVLPRRRTHRSEACAGSSRQHKASPRPRQHTHAAARSK